MAFHSVGMTGDMKTHTDTSSWLHIWDDTDEVFNKRFFLLYFYILPLIFTKLSLTLFADDTE